MNQAGRECFPTHYLILFLPPLWNSLKDHPGTIPFVELGASDTRSWRLYHPSWMANFCEWNSRATCYTFYGDWRWRSRIPHPIYPSVADDRHLFTHWYRIGEILHLSPCRMPSKRITTTHGIGRNYGLARAFNDQYCFTDSNAKMSVPG